MQRFNIVGGGGEAVVGLICVVAIVIIVTVLTPSLVQRGIRKGGVTVIVGIHWYHVKKVIPLKK